MLPVTTQQLFGLIATASTSRSWPRRTTGLASFALLVEQHRESSANRVVLHEGEKLLDLVSRCSKSEYSHDQEKDGFNLQALESPSQPISKAVIRWT
jgi:hypothetical protein